MEIRILEIYSKMFQVYFVIYCFTIYFYSHWFISLKYRWVYLL